MHDAPDGMNIRDRVIGQKKVPASSLRPSPYNWRTHPTQQRDALRGILAEVGFAGAELVRQCEDGSLELIDGHLRAEEMGNQLIPVTITDLTAGEAKKLLAVFDPIGDLAGADAEKLNQLLNEIELESPALLQMMDEIANGSGAVSDIQEADLPALPDGDKPPFEQMTFTLHTSQAESVKAAIDKAKSMGASKSEVNENSNGNALAFIAEVYLGEC